LRDATVIAVAALRPGGGAAMTAFAAAVLAGGQSRRMGRDKALVEVEGRPLIARVVDAARAAGADPVAVVGHRRPADLPTDLGAELVADAHPGEGPLGGVVTALDWCAAPICVVLACDLPHLDPADLRRLVAALDADPTAAVAALTGPAGPEPLVAAWRTAVTTAVRAAFDDGERAPHRVLSDLPGGCLTVTTSDAGRLFNVNTADDLRAATVTPTTTRR
jgi:molybdopterin-guanine dinucleotide biosynthesis protein A